MMKASFCVMLVNIMLAGCVHGPSRVATSRCLGVLRAGVASEDAVVRIHAAEALIKAGDRVAAESQLKALRTSDDDMARVLAARGLVRLGHIDEIETIIAVLNDATSKGRVGAAESLGKLGYDKAEKDIRKALSGTNDNTALWAHGTVALARFGDRRAAQDLLSKGLKHRDRGIRLVSAWGLGRIGLRSASASLYEMSQNGNEPAINRTFAAWSALTLGNGRVIPLLVGFLEHPEKSVRAYSLLALGENGIHSAGKKIEGLLNDGEEDVRVRAAEALLTLAGETRKGGP